MSDYTHVPMKLSHTLVMISPAELARHHAEHDALLEALRAASNYIDVLGGDSRRYRAVIAKLEGGNNE